MSEHRYDIKYLKAVLIRIRKSSKDRTQKALPVSRRGKSARRKKPHMSLKGYHWGAKKIKPD